MNRQNRDIEGASKPSRGVIVAEWIMAMIFSCVVFAPFFLEIEWAMMLVIVAAVVFVATIFATGLIRAIIEIFGGGRR